MKVWKRTLPAWLLILVMLLTACGTPSQSAQPDSTEGWRKVYEETGAYLQAQAAPSVGSIGGEWAVIGLSRAGLLSDAAAQSYEQAAEDYVKQAGSVRLHHAKSTENSRTILGLTAAGYDAANVAGVDLTAGLTDMAYLRAQGTNGPIWALIALDCHGYDIPQCADGRGAGHPRGTGGGDPVLSVQRRRLGIDGRRVRCGHDRHGPDVSGTLSGGDRRQGGS